MYDNAFIMKHKEFSTKSGRETVKADQYIICSTYALVLQHDASAEAAACCCGRNSGIGLGKKRRKRREKEEGDYGEVIILKRNVKLYLKSASPHSKSFPYLFLVSFLFSLHFLPISTLRFSGVRTNCGGSDDGLDQDPIVSSSRVIMVPGFSAIREHTGSGHDCNLVESFGGKPPGSEGPGHNCLPAVSFGSKTAVHHLALKADSEGMDDRPDQDPMVSSSRVIVFPGLLRFKVIGEHTSAGHDHNVVVSFGGKPPGSEGPGHNCLPTVSFHGKTTG
ncbi:hypothetical protein M5K25_003721 [Dendrobium thyrsiflorum]|uniref:Uncharacterized protein n=1 Tax=Dendrobium thyrsiflorum TaxID=117978 RepID=A0ABD0VJY7_DENTH